MTEKFYGKIESPEKREEYLSTPVFEIDHDWSPESGVLPGLWLSVPVVDEDTDEDAGRVFAFHYSGTQKEDPDGNIALELGGRYYNEAMEHQSPDEHGLRIECFRATELLYLHGAQRGNPYAFCNLGYVYSYNRCEGQFWEKHVKDLLGEFDWEFPADERAFQCYAKGAEAKIAEASYKLGDMWSRGRGCEQSHDKAFECYMDALGSYGNDIPAIAGSIFMRLGSSYENGYGCEQSFRKAENWYSRAQVQLQLAVDSGDWFYKKQLIRANNAVKCMRQEIDGSF